MRLLAPLSLVLLALLPFLGGLEGEFIEDDLGAIRDNVELREGGELFSVWADNYWGEVWGGLYRPLTIFSYGVDRAARIWSSKKTTGLLSRMALFIRPLASYGVEGITSLMPARFINMG